MSDTPLETMIIEGCKPPYKKTAWVIGHVGAKELVKMSQKKSPESITLANNYKRRPKSTPLIKFSEETGSQRKLRCSRFSQVKSATRRKSLENVWSPKEVHKMSIVELAPGYVLSRSKERVKLTIRTDDHSNEDKQQPSRIKTTVPDEKDLVIMQMRKQIDDLTLLLAEDRLNHRTSIRKTAQEHENHLAKIQDQHREHIRSVEEDHKVELEKLKKLYSSELDEERKQAKLERDRKQCELDTLRGAFEAYKETVALDMDYKWERREQRLHHDSELRLRDELTKQRKELAREKINELDATNKEHMRQVQVVAEDHKREIDRLMEKFSQSLADAGQLKKTLLEMQVLIQENNQIKEKLKKTSEKLRKTETELEDKKMKLQGFEENFAEKVAEVDEKYSMRMHSLMSSNADLRRHYIKKCEQVFKLNTEKDVKQEGSLRNAKETMQAVILARSRCNVSLTALRNEDLSSDSHSATQKNLHFKHLVPTHKSKTRPRSAPATPKEQKAALAETSVIESPRAKSCGIRLAEPQSSKLRPHTSHQSRHSSPRSSSTSTRELLQATPVSISNQGLRPLLKSSLIQR